MRIFNTASFLSLRGLTLRGKSGQHRVIRHLIKGGYKGRNAFVTESATENEVAPKHALAPGFRVIVKM